MSRIEKKSQIILQGGVALPQASRGNYRCYETLLSEQVEMISGRIVEGAGQGLVCGIRL